MTSFHRPVQAYWAIPRPPKGACLNGITLNAVLGTLFVVADFLIALFPLPFVMTLNLPKHLKLATASLLCLGLLAACAGKVEGFYLRLWLTKNRYTENLLHDCWPLKIQEVFRCQLGKLSPLVRCDCRGESGHSKNSSTLQGNSVLTLLRYAPAHQHCDLWSPSSFYQLCYATPRSHLS